MSGPRGPRGGGDGGCGVGALPLSESSPNRLVRSAPILASASSLLLPLATASGMSGQRATKWSPSCARITLNFLFTARVRSRLTSQPQRPGARDATIATATLSPGSLRMVNCLCRDHLVVSSLSMSAPLSGWLPLTMPGVPGQRKRTRRNSPLCCAAINPAARKRANPRECV